MRFLGKMIVFDLAALVAVVFATLPTLHARDGEAARTSPAFNPEQISFFETQVRPILKARCLKCHGEGPKVKGGLRLDSRESVLRGGDLGPAVVLNEPKESRLLQAIRYQEIEMPPAGKLPAGEIDVLTRWVTEGLPWSGATDVAVPVTSPAKAPAANAPKPIAHAWSLRPVVRPPVPVRQQPALVPQPNRCLPSVTARGGRLTAGARGRSTAP